MSVDVYQALVLDATPDPDQPGALKVKIPELFEDFECPYLVPPLFPGGVLGGWQNVPLPDSTGDEDRRVLVIRLAPDTFRWIGTSQLSPLLEAYDLTQVSGMISQEKRHAIRILDADGNEVDGISLLTSAAGWESSPANVTRLDLNPTTGVTLSTQEEAELLLHPEGSLELQTKLGRVAVDTSGNVEAFGPEVKLHHGGLTSAVIIDGTSVSFMSQLGSSLTELSTLLAGLGLAAPNAMATGGMSTAGLWRSTIAKGEGL